MKAVSLLALAALASARRVMPWMCLERCGEDIDNTLTQLRELVPSAVNSVSYEAFDLGWGSTIVDNGYTRVGPTLQGLGVETWPMITTANIEKLRELWTDHDTFIQQAIDAAQNYEIKFTGYNIDFEPSNADNMPTNDDALKFASFLTDFANALHPYNISLSVDIATWTAFFNYDALAATTCDRILTMDTYCGDNDLFVSRVQDTVNAFPLEKIGIGIETENPNTGGMFDDESIALRFTTLNNFNIEELDIWMTPIPDEYIPYMKSYLAGH